MKNAQISIQNNRFNIEKLNDRQNKTIPVIKLKENRINAINNQSDPNKDKNLQSSQKEQIKKTELYYKNKTWLEAIRKKKYNVVSSLDVNCDKNNSAINKFQLISYPLAKNKNINKLLDTQFAPQYSYSCVMSPSISDTCYSYSTPALLLFNSLEVNLLQLRKLKNKCPEGQVLKQFYLGNNDPNGTSHIYKPAMI